MADAEHALPLALQRASEALILMQEKSFFQRKLSCKLCKSVVKCDHHHQTRCCFNMEVITPPPPPLPLLSPILSCFALQGEFD